MRNLAMKLMYNGTAYHGWQVQKTQVTVGETLERAVGMVCGHKVHITGCGRTDAGVHARAQVASVALSGDFTPEEVAACEASYTGRYLKRML